MHEFSVEVYFDPAVRDNVSVELYAEPTEDGQPKRIPMSRSAELKGTATAHIYSSRFRSDRPSSDYTVRIIPSKPEAFIPLEANPIAWHRQ